MLDEACGRTHFVGSKHRAQFEGIDGSFAQIVIIGDNKGCFRFGCDFLGAFLPLRQFTF